MTDRERIRRLEARLARLEAWFQPAIDDPAMPEILAEVETLCAHTLAMAREEVAGSMRYYGIWQDGAAYPRGALITHAGGGFVAERDANPGERPGTGSAWRLAVKSDASLVRRAVRDELARLENAKC